MTREERYEFLRQRAAVLFPKGKAVPQKPLTPAQAKRRARANEVPHKHVRAFYSFGVATADHVVSWIEAPDEKEEPKVAPLKARHGATALTVISEKLRAGVDAPDRWYGKCLHL